jgi:hypothetical protein
MSEDCAQEKACEQAKGRTFKVGGNEKGETRTNEENDERFFFASL